MAALNEPDTRIPYPACETCEQYGDDVHAPRGACAIRVPDSIEEVIGFDALWDSMELCKRGVTWKGSVASFVSNGAERIAKMSSELRDGTYVHGRTTTFEVSFPKRRVIVAQTFRDRVLHRSMVENLLVPCVFPRLIYDNAACQKGKGTDFARQRYKRFLGEHFRRHGTDGYVLMVDIRKYYDSMRHSDVRELFSSRLPDWGTNLVMWALDSQYPGEMGYNPGSSIVQVAGVSLLDDVDHAIKERLSVRHYTRYMDDFRLIHHDRGFLEECVGEIAEMVGGLGFCLHPRKTRIAPISSTTPYLGFDFTLTETGKVLMTIDPASAKHMRRKVGRLAKLEIAGERPAGTTRAAYEGWRAHASRGDSTRLVRKCDGWFRGLWKRAEGREGT